MRQKRAVPGRGLWASRAAWTPLRSLGRRRPSSELEGRFAEDEGQDALEVEGEFAVVEAEVWPEGCVEEDVVLEGLLLEREDEEAKLRGAVADEAGVLLGEVGEADFEAAVGVVAGVPVVREEAIAEEDARGVAVVVDAEAVLERVVSNFEASGYADTGRLQPSLKSSGNAAAIEYPALDRIVRCSVCPPEDVDLW